MAAYVGQIIGSADGHSRLVFRELIDNLNLDLLDKVDLKFQLHAENKELDNELQQELKNKGLLGADNYLHREAEAVDADLEVKLDPVLNDVLVFSQSNRFTVTAQLPNGAIVPQHLVSTVNLTPSPLQSAGAAFAEGSAQVQPQPQGAAAFGAAPNAAAAADNPFAAGAAAQPAPVPAAQSKSKLPLIIGLIVLLALIGAALWFFLLRGGNETAATSSVSEHPAAEQSVSEPEPTPATAPEPEPTVEPEPTAPAPEAAAPAALGTYDFDAAKTDADAISGCMSLNDEQALLQLALSAADNQRCDLAKRILLAKGRSVGGEFASKLAEFFDPNTPENPCFAKSADDAAYWQGKAGNAQSAKPQTAPVSQSSETATAGGAQ